MVLLLSSITVIAQPLTIEIEELPTINEKVLPNVLMIDDFEDKNLTDYRNWWHFGTIIINTKNVTEKKNILGQLRWQFLQHRKIGMPEDLAYT